jgi:hypothetical protein
MRPLTKSPEKTALILDHVAAGKTIGEACRAADITLQTFRIWRDNDAALDAAFYKALETGADAIAQEALSIVDARPETFTDKNGNARFDPAGVAWQKLRADMRLRLLAQWAPRTYGARVDVSGQLEVKHDNPAVQELVALVRAAKRGNAIEPGASAPMLAAPDTDASDLL